MTIKKGEKLYTENPDRLSLQVNKILTRKIYENVIIGNFLYGLGFAVRSHLNRDALFPSAINLLQQTPVDRELADVLLSFPGVVRLIEFKMKGASLKKEKIRHRLLTAALSSENVDLVKISRNLHWYVEISGKFSESPLVSRVVPYLDAFDTDNSALAAGSLEQFVEQTAREAVLGEDSVPRSLSEIYLRLLRSLQGSDPVDAGGVLLVMGGDGAMHFSHVQDISDISMPHQKWLDIQMRAPEFEKSTILLEKHVEQPELKRSGPTFGM